MAKVNSSERLAKVQVDRIVGTSKKLANIVDRLDLDGANWGHVGTLGAIEDYLNEAIRIAQDLEKTMK